MPSHLELFCPKRLENYVLCTFIFIFLCMEVNKEIKLDSKKNILFFLLHFTVFVY